MISFDKLRSFGRLRMTVVLASLTFAGCGHAQSAIGLVDTQRLLQFWPKYQNYNNQLSVDMAALDRARTSQTEKVRERAALQQKYSRVQAELTQEVRSAATEIAKGKNLQLVVTRQFVGYGGTDITPEVEKILKITETSPSPSP